MTHQANTLIQALLLDLKNNPDTPAKYAMAAVITATRHSGYCEADFREMMNLLRAEYGMSREAWEKMMIELLAEIPQVAGHAQDLARLD